MVAIQPITQLSQSLAQAPTPQADRDRLELMKHAWDAYRGKFPMPLSVPSNQPNDNVISNRCRPIIDKGVSFLFGNVLKISTSDSNQAIQQFIDCLWGNDDQRMTTLSSAAINGGICGEVFLQLIPTEGTTMKYPRIVVLDPMNLRIVTHPDDCSLILSYIIEYQGLNTLQTRKIFARVDPDNNSLTNGYEEVDDTWTITTYQRKGNANTYGSWYQVGQQIEWNYPFAPIFCCPNLPNPNEPWGTPDLTQDLIDQNKSLNFVQSNLARIIKYHGHPFTYATGIRDTQMQMSVDNILCLPDPSSKIEKIGAMDNFAGIIQFANVIRDNMDEQSRVPAVALGRIEALPRGTISGVALELLFQPLIEKTIQKQRLYGCLIRDITKAALVCAGLLSLDQYEEFEIDLHWSNLLPIDNSEAAQTALALLQIGVSQQTVLQQLGYDPENEAQKIQDHQSVSVIQSSSSKQANSQNSYQGGNE